MQPSVAYLTPERPRSIGRIRSTRMDAATYTRRYVENEITERAKWAQRELCAKLKRRNNYIQNIESGRQSVRAAELHIIARACGSTGAELLGRAIQATDK